MKQNVNNNDPLTINLEVWKQDFEPQNPYLASKIMDNLNKNHNFSIIPFKLTKVAVSGFIIIAIFSGYFLHLFNEQQSINSSLSPSYNEEILLQQYTTEMYITEIKQSEIEDFFSKSKIK